MVIPFEQANEMPMNVVVREQLPGKYFPRPIILLKIFEERRDQAMDVSHDCNTWGPLIKIDQPGMSPISQVTLRSMAAAVIKNRAR